MRMKPVARGARHGRPPLRESGPTKGRSGIRSKRMEPPGWDGWRVGKQGPGPACLWRQAPRPLRG